MLLQRCSHFRPTNYFDSGSCIESKDRTAFKALESKDNTAFKALGELIMEQGYIFHLSRSSTRRLIQTTVIHAMMYMITKRMLQSARAMLDRVESRFLKRMPELVRKNNWIAFNSPHWKLPFEHFSLRPCQYCLHQTHQRSQVGLLHALCPESCLLKSPARSKQYDGPANESSAFTDHVSGNTDSCNPWNRSEKPSPL